MSQLYTKKYFQINKKNRNFAPIKKHQIWRQKVNSLMTEFPII